MSLLQQTKPWDALDAIRKAVSIDQERPANSFTLVEYASRYRMTAKAAETQLKRLVQMAKLQTKKCLVNSRIANVYWIPEVKCQSSTRSTTGPTSKRKGPTGG